MAAWLGVLILEEMGYRVLMRRRIEVGITIYRVEMNKRYLNDVSLLAYAMNTFNSYIPVGF